MPSAAVVVAGHDDRGVLAARQVPEARQRHAVEVHAGDEVGEQALLLVGLRDRDLVQVDPVGLLVPGLAPKKRSSERITGSMLEVALLARPGRVALAGETTERARS